MTSFIMIILFCLVSMSLGEDKTVKKVRHHDCKSQFNVLSVTVSPCKHGGARPCELRKGHNATVSITFIPDRDVTALKAVVKGKLPSVSVWGPFNLLQDNACVNQGLECPLKAGQNYTYTQSVFVEKMFPKSVAMIMWTLNDESNDEQVRDDGKSIREVCVVFRGKIVDPQ